VTSTNPIPRTAVRGLQDIGELSATIGVAWVERLSDDAGAKHDRILAAKVVCAPLADGG